MWDGWILWTSQPMPYLMLSKANQIMFRLSSAVQFQLFSLLFTSFQISWTSGSDLSISLNQAYSCGYPGPWGVVVAGKHPGVGIVFLLPSPMCGSYALGMRKGWPKINDGSCTREILGLIVFTFKCICSLSAPVEIFSFNWKGIIIEVDIINFGLV